MTGSLFPLRVIQLDPGTLRTADCDHIGKADDGMDYAIKTGARNRETPGAEFSCYELARLCGLAVPQHNILQMPDGTEAFGSRWEGGVTQDNGIIQQVLTGVISSSVLSERLSAIFTFDLFVHNPDRHLNNYLFSKARHDYAVIAFDFSRAWTAAGWPLPSPPLMRSCNTMRTYGRIAKFQPFGITAAQEALSRLRKIPVRAVQDVYSRMPNHWLDKKRRNEIIKWWGSAQRTARLDETLKGLKDGTYLYL